VHIGLNLGAVLVGTVIVGGDAASAKVDPLAQRGIAQVGQVIGLGSFGQR
jgi:outer membrane murein-binding lipoprotein Lpp